MQMQTPNRTHAMHARSAQSVAIDPIPLMQQRIEELQKEVQLLKAYCGALFDNDNRLAKWVYFAHPNIPTNHGPLFTRLKAYQPYEVTPTYPFQPTHVYGCNS